MENLEYGKCSVCGMEGEINIVLEHFESHILNEEDDAIATGSERREENEETNTTKWTDKTIRLLLTLYQENLHFFKSNKKTNKSVWQIISKKINEMGYQLTSDQYDLKFRHLKKTYKRIKDNNNQTGRGHKTWLYFQYFEELFGNDADLNPTCVVGTLISNNEAGPSSSSSENSRCSTRAENTPAIECEEETLTASPTSTRTKRRRMNNEEPDWAKQFRQEQAVRHEEKMSLLKELIQTLKDNK